MKIRTTNLFKTVMSFIVISYIIFHFLMFELSEFILQFTLIEDFDRDII